MSESEDPLRICVDLISAGNTTASMATYGIHLFLKKKIYSQINCRNKDCDFNINLHVGWDAKKANHGS